MTRPAPPVRPRPVQCRSHQPAPHRQSPLRQWPVVERVPRPTKARRPYPVAAHVLTLPAVCPRPGPCHLFRRRRRLPNHLPDPKSGPDTEDSRARIAPPPDGWRRPACRRLALPPGHTDAYELVPPPPQCRRLALPRVKEDAPSAGGPYRPPSPPPPPAACQSCCHDPGDRNVVSPSAHRLAGASAAGASRRTSTGRTGAAYVS